MIGYPSVLIWRPSGADKTTFAAWLLRQRIERGHEALILDPHRAAGQWEGLPCIGDGMNYAAIDAALERHAAMCGAKKVRMPRSYKSFKDRSSRR